MFVTILQEGLYATVISPGATDMPIILLLPLLLCGYLLGSLNSAVIVSRCLYHDDVRAHGSGNAGLTNMFRVYGKRAAAFTLLGDIFKAALAVFLGGFFFGFYYAQSLAFGYMGYITGFACVIGHIKPVFYHFRGGKGVLCTAVVVLILAPVVFAVLFLSFLLIVWLTRYISLGSVVVAGLFPIAMQGYMQTFLGQEKYDGALVLLAICFTVVIVFCHRQNLVRLWNHKENKFSFHRHHDGEEEK